MGPFEELQKKLKLLSEEARKILKAKQVTEKLAIPGTAVWMGYNSDNKPTVKKNGQIIVVKTTSTINLPIGSIVYIDETLTVQYKNNKPKKEERDFQKAETSYKRRPFKKRRSTPIGPRNISSVKGSTWLVYHDYLKELNLTTEAAIGTNPKIVGWSLFLSLAPLAILGGGVLLGVIFWTLFDVKAEPVEPIRIKDLPDPEDHPDISSNTNLDADEYNFFIILQGVIDQFAQSYPFLQTDGLFLGVNFAIANLIFFIGGDTYTTFETYQTPGCNVTVSGITFSNKYVLRPWQYSLADQLVGLLFHFGPYKVQACLYRIVGVYPPKRFKVNIHSWQVPDFDIPDLDKGSENYFEVVNNLLPMKHKQFVIPDDVLEWDKLIGNGAVIEQNTRSDVFPYEIIPAHDAWTYGQDSEAYDLTKFAAFSENNLYLNYIIKAHAPWTNLDDALRINYYSLNLRITDPGEDEELQIAYTLKPTTFGIPSEFTFAGKIYVEDPQFPLQGGDRPEATRQITYRIKGTDDPTQSTGILFITALRGDQEKRGLLPGLDPDAPPIVKNPESGIFSYVAGASLEFQVDSAPSGFVYNKYTGEYIFDQNVSEYSLLGPGQTRQIDFNYIAKDPSGGESIGGVSIIITGSSSTFVSPGFPEPPAVASNAGLNGDAPPPENEWDPEPFIESEATGQDQIFEKVTSTIPLPESDTKGCPWVLGRVSKLQIKEIEPPIIKLKVGDTYYDEPEGYDASDFIFSVTTDETRLSSAENFLTDFTIKKANYDKLASNQELTITYTIKAMYNTAPFVGNWENVSEFQKRKVRSDFIKFAFAGDWRGRISNKRQESPFLNYFSTVEEESPTRDTPRIPEINIDIPNRDLTANWIREFFWYSKDPDKADPKIAIALENEDGSTRTFDEESVRLVNLDYEFNEQLMELLFYAPGDSARIEPLDDESILEAMEQGVEIPIRRKWVWDALPSGTDRADDSGMKWRVDRELTKPLKGYLIFGWAD